MPDYWLAIVVVGVGTYLFRLSFLVSKKPAGEGGFLAKFLAYSPAAALGGLVAPSIFGGLDLGQAATYGPLVAAAAAVALHYAFKKSLLTIAGGLVFLYVWQNFAV